MVDLISFGAGFLSLVVVKTVAEPLAVLVGRWTLSKIYSGIDDLLPDIWDTFDLEWLPQAYKQDANPKQWLEEIIPAKAEAKGLELPNPIVKAIAGYVVKEFDLQKHLDKVRHAQL
jgi:hypothetical protein